jgi:hypothetical protein
LLVSCLAILTLAAPVQAYTTYDFRAVDSFYEIPGDLIPYGDFSFRYTDNDDDGRFSVDELVSGSFTQPRVGSIVGVLLGVVQAPEYHATKSPLTDGPAGAAYWILLKSTGNSTQDRERWTYSQSSVPIPASVFLLGTGLIALAWSRRKKLLGP